MMTDLIEKNHEQQVKKLKRLLEGWRVALIPLKSIILWEQQWHPCAIFASTTLLYLIIWLMDLNFLTTIAVLGLIINFIDFIVPIICNSLYGQSSWTGQKEKTFDDICRSIVVYYNNALNHLQIFYSFRETSPFVYYIISISILCTLAWLASSINNIFLFYILSTSMFMWPGIQHRGIFNSLWMFRKAPKLAFSKIE